MAGRIKVKLQDTAPARVIFLDPAATEGATLGKNVFLPNGSVGTPATVREWLSISAAPETPNGGTQHHRLLQGLTLGNDHPQYPLKAGTETISGQWNFTQQMRVADGSANAPAYSWEDDRDNGLYRIGDNNIGFATSGSLRWDINTTRTLQTLPAIVRNYSGLLVENPDYLNAGIELTTITGTNPLNNGIGNQLAFWEVGVGGAFTDRSYGFRFRHTGEIDAEGNLDFYRHTNSTSGVLFLRFTRESSQIQFASGSSANPVITFIGDTNTGIYSRIGDELNFTAGSNETLRMTNLAVSPQVQVRNISGSASTPSYGFASDVDNGMYLIGGNNLGFSVGGTLRFDMTTSLATFAIPVLSTTFEVGATDTTLARAGAGIASIEGHNIATVSQAQTISAIYSFSAAPRLGSLLTPATITANQDNYAPTGIDNASSLRLATDASRDITGITTGADGRFLFLTNVGAENIVLRHQNTGSSAANRFLFDSGGSLTVEPEATILLWYDNTTQRWRAITGGGGGGGSVNTVVAGEGIDVDSTDAANPIVSLDIPSLTAESTPDGATDYVAIYSATATAHRKVLLQDLPGGGGGSGQVVRFDVYTANDTWNKPSGFAFGLAIGIGQGGGGASGRLNIAGQGRVGGGGGGGGGRSVVYFNNSDVGSSVAVAVNGGGVGGAAITTSAADGNAGTAGANTTFGSLLAANGGGGGTGGTSSGNAPAGSGGTGNAGNGSNGGLGYATAAQTPAALAGGSTGAGGGCGGAGVSAGNSSGTGGAGANGVSATGGAGGGAPQGGNGSAGGAGNGYNNGGAGGGSGTGSNISTTLGGSGGNGGDFGGGGGGGAGGTVLSGVGESGAGGNGGAGILIVISWMNVGAGTGIIDSVVAGAGIAVNNSDPINPVVSLDASTAAAGTWPAQQTFTAGIGWQISNNQPAAQFVEEDQGTDGKRWRIRCNGGNFLLETRYDDNSVGTTAIQLQRSATAVTNIVLGNSTDNPTITVPGTGAILNASAGSVSLPDYAFNSDADTGMYRVGANILGLVAGATAFLTGGTTYADMPLARRYTGVISPAQLTANTNNYNPTGLGSCSVMRLSTDASRNLTGITAQAAGTRITICNVGAQDLVLVHNATSTAANQFLCPGSGNYTLNANDSVDIWYDSTSSRWRVIAAA